MLGREATQETGIYQCGLLQTLMRPWRLDMVECLMRETPQLRESIHRAKHMYGQVLEGALGEEYIPRGYLANQYEDFVKRFRAECQVRG